jgi:hypothetical protein
MVNEESARVKLKSVEAKGVVPISVDIAVIWGDFPSYYVKLSVI